MPKRRESLMGQEDGMSTESPIESRILNAP
jgi:hypothetical protein